MNLLKDDRLASLAETGNVAQFVSFSPAQAELRHARLDGDPHPRDLAAAVEALLVRAMDASVNVRSFTPEREKGCPFHYGLRSVDEVVALVHSLAAQGFHTILNETIDVHDGGVSGVALGGVVEFAPDDTPRAVEKPGVAVLPHALAVDLLRTVYGFAPDIPEQPGTRLEFSIHPTCRGYRRTHTLWWETEQVEPTLLGPPVVWPNRFSRHIGDKTFGLLMAHCLGHPVPATTVMARRVAPFQFGRPTGSGETWLRTCPTEQVPGQFTTLPHWSDPFALVAKEDPDGDALAAVLAQEGVLAEYSGATLPMRPGEPDRVEGVRGTGDDFMLGELAPERLPARIVDDVLATTGALAQHLGPVRIEWAHDGRQVWVLQMHIARRQNIVGDVLNPGEASTWIRFDVADGLETLRVLLAESTVGDIGIEIVGRIGLTSHVGDLIRKAGVPARFALERED
jgi:hypothetical protein